MSYNTDNLRTAGKITVYTALMGVLVFAVVFIFNLGEKQVKQADAQSNATTSVTVLNTPPLWTATTTELIESSQTNPTNEGNTVSWIAVGTDSNSENYHLLICSTSVAPATTTGGNPPSCGAGATQWAVSASTVSGAQATAATTTLASTSPFAGESFEWFAWICDANALSSRCNSTYTQGTDATNTSPFEVNHRPSFTVFTDPVVGNPGQSVTFYSSSTDDDISGPDDQVYLTVCAIAGFSTTTGCTGTTLATSTVYVDNHASGTYTIIIPTQDQNYDVYPYIMDSHGLEASGGEQGQASTLTVNNVAPTVDGAFISLTQPVTTDMLLTVASGETTGFVMSFVTSDDNSCDAPGGLNAFDEIQGYNLSLYRNGGGVSSTTCDASSIFNPNSCYPSGVAPTAWNLTCTASSTTCTGSSDTTMLWECTFPLWYIADPTDGTATSTQYSTLSWAAQVRGRDDDAAVGAYSESTNPVDVKSFLAFALNTLSIPYGSLEPGQKTPLLVATTTIAATGNVGLDKDVQGQSMCSTYTNASPCLPSDTSTIPEDEQVFATSTITYDDAEALGYTLSSTTAKEIEINVPKSTATSTQATANAYWGIRVPGTITFAGSYTGENTFTARVGESVNW
jgi:hypothetical protein